ncbi:hypothetical protein ARMGADRAFT_158467 [Armillaria gallica]|uniref:Uncharacterized protein n=1 Tax=Armillaria gallica TaxID=47427 RepID=A0A2H3CD96_ARMGA|nr:hypothetical protein ARMGADRAFT_158467 [Armillaria gallica]
MDAYCTDASGFSSAPAVHLFVWMIVTAPLLSGVCSIVHAFFGCHSVPLCFLPVQSCPRRLVRLSSTPSTSLLLLSISSHLPSLVKSEGARYCTPNRRLLAPLFYYTSVRCTLSHHSVSSTPRVFCNSNHCL